MSRRPRPVFLKWDGDVFTPAPSFKAYCDREYVIGEVYPMLPVEERSMASHNHYFAALSEGFNNLSEENAKRFPTVEHLRHWALVQIGYADHVEYAMADGKQARKLAADVRAMSQYAIITVKENIVHVWTAQSQSHAAMKKEKFEQSKSDVLDLVASMARTTQSQLNKEARHHGR